MKEAMPPFEGIVATEEKCLLCGAENDTRVLLACKYKGEDRWVCVKCLPRLIHGPEGCEH